LFVKDTNQKSVLVVIAEGFNEIEAIVFLSLLRQAGLCVKTVGLTSGLISSAHGVWLMPDLTLADLDRSTDAISVSAVILPGGGRSLSQLETDPRVHRLLRRVVAQQGQIVTGREGLRIPRAAAVWASELGESDDEPGLPVLLRPPDQSLEAFIRDLIRRLKH
jgi:hypothetical protein